MAKLSQRSVLTYRKGRRSQSTARRHFLEWRAQQSPPIPFRCDVPNCEFHSGELEWNGAQLHLVLDHANGVSGDNSPANLRFLCPNCNSQQATHGGSNKGRVIQDTGGYAKVASDGKRHYVLPIDSGEYKISAGTAAFEIKRKA